MISGRTHNIKFQKNSKGRFLIEIRTHLTHSGNGPMAIKSEICYISKNYLTTNDPYHKRVEKNFKIRKLYSPDPDSGSGIPEI